MPRSWGLCKNKQITNYSTVKGKGDTMSDKRISRTIYGEIFLGISEHTNAQEGFELLEDCHCKEYEKMALEIRRLIFDYASPVVKGAMAGSPIECFHFAIDRIKELEEECKRITVFCDKKIDKIIELREALRKFDSNHKLLRLVELQDKKGTP